MSGSRKSLILSQFLDYFIVKHTLISVKGQMFTYLGEGTTVYISICLCILLTVKKVFLESK